MPSASAAIGRDPQRERVAGDQAFDRRGGGARLVLVAPFSAALAWRIPFSPSQASATPIGSRTAVRMSSSLAAVGRRANRSAARHQAAYGAGGLAELAEQVEKVVGDVFAQRIVIDRTQRPPEIARALPSRALSEAADFFERPESPAPSVLLRFLHSTPVPLARVHRALNQLVSQAQRSNCSCPASTRINGPAAAPWSAAQSPAQPWKPNGRSFVPVLLHIFGGGEAFGASVLPGLQQFRRAAKDGANSRFSRENTRSCPLARNLLRTCHSFAAMRAP